MKRKSLSGTCLLLAILLAACTSPDDRRLEQALQFAGANRSELEKVLAHYKGELPEAVQPQLRSRTASAPEPYSLNPGVVQLQPRSRTASMKNVLCLMYNQREFLQKHKEMGRKQREMGRKQRMFLYPVSGPPLREGGSADSPVMLSGRGYLSVYQYRSIEPASLHVCLQRSCRHCVCHFF